MRTGFGKINFLYSSIYNGKNNLILKPLSFQESRINNFEKSIKNPLNFASYFDLNSDKEKLDENYPNSGKKIKRVEFDYLDNIILCLFKIKEDEIYFSDLNEFENFDMDYHPTKRNEFEFDENGIFFKTDFLIYEQVNNFN
jgi:hypothetical protein